MTKMKIAVSHINSYDPIPDPAHFKEDKAYLERLITKLVNNNNPPMIGDLICGIEVYTVDSRMFINKEVIEYYLKS